jgi:hypothetical protein
VTVVAGWQASGSAGSSRDSNIRLRLRISSPAAEYSEDTMGQSPTAPAGQTAATDVIPPVAFAY